MHRIDSANSVGSPPAPAALGTEGYFEDGTTGGGDGTTVDADFMNMVQETILDLLDDQSIAHSKSDYTGLTAAVLAKIRATLATETLKGSVELATDAEALAGTATDKVVTPANLASNLDLVGIDGLVEFPGGLIMQWGTIGALSSKTTVDVTLPLTYPTKHWIAMANSTETGVDNNGLVQARQLSLSQIQIQNTASSPAQATTSNWFSLGY